MTRRIDLPPYPRGWFAVASSERPREAGDVRPDPLFRTRPRALPDGGAASRGSSTPTARTSAPTSATAARSKGDELVCPFHGWRFGERRRLYAACPTASGSPTNAKSPPPGRCARSTAS